MRKLIDCRHWIYISLQQPPLNDGEVVNRFKT